MFKTLIAIDKNIRTLFCSQKFIKCSILINETILTTVNGTSVMIRGAHLNFLLYGHNYYDNFDIPT